MKSDIFKSIVIFKLLTEGSLLPKELRPPEVTCKDLNKVAVVGPLFVTTSSREFEAKISCLLSTNIRREPIDIGPKDWSGLQKNGFDPSKKTIIVVHGYLSDCKKPWVLELKEKLLDAREANIILVDWSSSSNRKNYVTAAINTIYVSEALSSFLQTLKPQVEKLKASSNETLWNHLYFIGHSLGVQVSAQTAHRLKDDKFWKVERITGLDPAKPCFEDVDSSLKIDKNDAEFVDIIHTQIGNGGNADAFGLKEVVGHIDFYVNGGVNQPGCMGSWFMWDHMICSHQQAYKYFIETVANSVNSTCPLKSYNWNGSKQLADWILRWKEQGRECDECPEMGLNAVNSKQRGTFMVITSANEPFCQFKNKDPEKVKKVLEQIKDELPIFAKYNPMPSL